MLTTMKDIMGVFNSDYDGGDFCKALIFGRDGANMLFEVASTFVESEENHEYENTALDAARKQQKKDKKRSTK